MGRRRTTNQGLPPGLHMKGERYYHVTTTTPRKWTPLGKNRARALLEWARIAGTEPDPNVRTFDVIAQRYEREVMPTKAPRTQKDNLIELDRLRAVFGRMLIEAIKPHHVRGYLDKRGQSAKARANREKALLSHVFNKAREWGYTDAPNPCQGVKGFTEAGRDRYVTDDEFKAVREQADPTVRDAMDLALLTGQRPADVLKIMRTDVRDGTLFVAQNKTGAKRAIEIVGELAEVVERIKTRPRVRQSAYLVQDDDGKPLSLLALRGRFDKARKAAGVSFQFRDIRAKTASDTGDLGHSQRLLGHKNRDMTEHYVRERIGQRVKPLR
ncbi:tyrosine-type recombinase/integrase [Pseudaquabacterium pictum]|uniref:Integrase n=1 Tax=Pseudaquabacterium pictum TaxID=2315236 RepID=A0A480B1Y9_9BURK|nr:tyrosine-type recombinase/integrase [Rubrivivax pictus]GCL66367.1 integrase [Rubrivivax pictus]